MTSPAYPASREVSPGQATAASQYNDLRRDALTLGAQASDARSLAEFFCRYIDGISLVYLPTNRLRVPAVTTRPPTLMINGYMCQACHTVHGGSAGERWTRMSVGFCVVCHFAGVALVD